MSPEEIEAVLSKKERKSEESEVARDIKIRAADDSGNESFFIDSHHDCDGCSDGGGGD